MDHYFGERKFLSGPRLVPRAPLPKKHTHNRCQARENTQPLQSVGRHTTGAKRGKYKTGAKRWKTHDWRGQARESTQPVQSTGKYTTGAKRGKTALNRCPARENIRK